MTNNIKLYIDKQIVDLQTSDLQFTLVKEIADFQDPSKRNGEYSYSIKLPTTKNNIKIFRFINLIDTIGKFNRTKNYECQLYSNDNNLIDGFFVITEITESTFTGNIINKFKGDIISLMGTKTLQNLNLPQIDFEGLMIPVQTIGAHGLGTFQTPTLDVLNPNLCFDFYSLTNAKKIPIQGMWGTQIDYSDYYAVPLLAYSNFFTNLNITQLNTITNNFGLDDFKPSIKLIKVLKQMFIDIGYNLEIDNALINDMNILLPYFGSDSPVWNWLQLSRTFVYTDTSVINALSKISSNASGDFHIGQYKVQPIISSQQFTHRTQTLNTANYNIFTDTMNLGSNNINDTANYLYSLNDEESDSYKVHLVPTNGLKYDFNNNFSSLAPAARNNTDNGWVYNVPADGVYEFDLEVNHDIRTYNYNRFGQWYLIPDNTFSVDMYKYYPSLWMYDNDKKLMGNALGYDGIIQGNKTWCYNSQEKFHAKNMVCFVKENEFDRDGFLSTFQDEFNIPVNPQINVVANSAKGNLQVLNSGGYIRNFLENSTIAYYCPLFRDLYTGDHNGTWENYIAAENSILINPNVIPQDFTDENELVKYQGFNADTVILNFENNICYDPATIPTPNNQGRPLSPLGNEKPYNDVYSIAEQLKRKMVRLKRKNKTAQNRDRQFYDHYIPLLPQLDLNPSICEAGANGIVKFKFKTNLKRGDQIRMYYVTSQQFKEVSLANPYVVDLQEKNGKVPFGENFNDPSINGGKDGYGNDLFPMTYNDAYFDEMTINKLSIRCISDDLYSNKLQLANFLPPISQASFIQDFIKSNNLYFNFDNNNVILKARKDYFKNLSQMDLTNRITFDTFENAPVILNKNYQYGISANQDDDFNGLIVNQNPLVEVDLGNSIYLDQDLSDLTSTILFSSYDRAYAYRKYSIDWNTNGAFRLGTSYDLYNLLLPSFIEGGDSKIDLADSNPNYDRQPRLSYFNGNYNIDMNIVSLMLVNDIPFEFIKLKSALSNIGFLNNGNKYNLFIDNFTDLTNSSILTINAYIDANVYSQLDLSKPISINNTIYYIQSINGYNPLTIGLTQLILLKY